MRKTILLNGRKRNIEGFHPVYLLFDPLKAFPRLINFVRSQFQKIITTN